MNAEGGFTLKNLLIVLVLGVLSLLPCPNGEARPISFVRVPLTICLTNEAEVPLNVVTEVESRVNAIFRESAIELHWVNSGTSQNGASTQVSCGHLSYPDRLMVHWIPRAQTATADVLGETFLDEQDAGVIADLFLDHVRTVESDTKVGLATLLAYVTAHEVGHLLLGTNSHSPRGIMQGHFYGQNLVTMRHSGLTFERSEEERMHCRLLAKAR